MQKHPYGGTITLREGTNLRPKRPGVVILFWVTAWFNGKAVSVHDRTVSTASAYEPPLRQLCGDDWEPHFDQAHERLIERGLFKSQSRGENV